MRKLKKKKTWIRRIEAEIPEIFVNSDFICLLFIKVLISGRCMTSRNWKCFLKMDFCILLYASPYPPNAVSLYCFCLVIYYGFLPAPVIKRSCFLFFLLLFPTIRCIGSCIVFKL